VALGNARANEPINVDTRRRSHRPAQPASDRDGTYGMMSGHGGAGDAHRVVCSYNFLAGQGCILTAVEKLAQDGVSNSELT
jgi:hypothetical protein